MIRETGELWRLPTEAEWEYAARAGTTTPFYTGDCITTSQANYNGNKDYDNCGAKTGIYMSKTEPVGSYPPNPRRLYDMHGNVWEWVGDCYHDSYKDAPTDGSAWTQRACTERVLRGGSWDSYPRDLRCAARGGLDPSIRSTNFGFRVAKKLTF